MPVDKNEAARLSVVIVGHVDHGKSTLLGRLLADTGNLPEGKLDAIRERCLRNSKPLEYAYLLDALRDEQSQNITIDSARCFFRSAKRAYLLIDAPGHVEFLQNMVTGAARADAALLVIDAYEGVRENSRRHGYFLSMLGIRQFAVCVTKMDLVAHDPAVFERIRSEYSAFLERVSLRPDCFIPVSAPAGANVAAHSDLMPWYQGPTVLEAMDSFEAPSSDEDRPLRMPVQDVYRFAAMGDKRRIVAGRVESGRLAVGDTVVFMPSGKRTVVKTIEEFGAPAPAGFTCVEELYVTRGEVVCREGEPLPSVSTRLRADLFWLGREPMRVGADYKIKIGTAESPARLESIERVLNAATLDVDEHRDEVRRHEVARCVLRARRPLAFDPACQLPVMGRFVVVDRYTIAGGGIVCEALPDEEAALRAEALERDQKWVQSRLTPPMRAERYCQRAALVVITGARGTGRRELARSLEEHLFGLGRMVYYLGMGSVVHGLDADIRKDDLGDDVASREHVRRLGEVLHVLLDAGLIVICTAIELSARDLRDIATLVAPACMLSIYLGPKNEPEADLWLDAPCDPSQAIPLIIEQLKANKVIPDL